MELSFGVGHMRNYFNIVVYGILGAFAAISVAGADAKSPAGDGVKTMHKPASSFRVTQLKSSWMRFKPPLRGAPKNRIGGGTRGSDSADALSLVILAPEETGITNSDQPTLYWFASKVTKKKIILTVMDNEGIDPLLETEIKAPTVPGVNAVPLTNFNVRLVSKHEYLVSLSVVVDETQRSNDIVATAGIRFLVRNKQAPTSETDAEAADRLAGDGVWYDALNRLSHAIEAMPGDKRLRENRASLLQQVGLPEPAAYDLRHSQNQ